MKRQDVLTILEGKSFVNKRTNYYHTAILACTNPGKKFYCGKRSGINRYATTISWQWDLVALFKRLGFVDYEVGNDAPRNGKQGDFVIVYEDK